jgi:8-oxo-dGTP pyrophosphatase MutT (NUDIX family)
MTKPVFKNRQNELVTTTDGRQLYNSRSVAVVLVLICMNPDEEYRIAIEKRGNNPGLDKKGMWCLPCGYLDWDESGPDAVRREVWEEIGLNLNDYTNVMIGDANLEQPWFVKTLPNENRQNITLRYGMVIIQKEWPKLTANNDCEPDEVADAVWAKYSDVVMGKYEFAFSHKEVIAEFWHRFIKE